MSVLVPALPAVGLWIAVAIVGIAAAYLVYAQSKIVKGYEQARGGLLARVRGETIGYVGAKQRLDAYHAYYRDLEADLGEHMAFVHELTTNPDEFWRTIGYEYYLQQVSPPD